MSIAVCSLLLFVSWLFVNLQALWHNHRRFRNPCDYTKEGTLLVVVAHQDDEVVVAGGAMLRTLQKGGQVHVVYTTDGTRRADDASAEWVEEHICRREQESLECLKSIGIPAHNAHFFRIRNEHGLHDPRILRGAIERISTLIVELEPYAVVTCSYEGGHIEHDLTNYAVAQAVQCTSLREEQILEAPEYNDYFLSESIFRRVNRFLFVKYIIAPQFIPHEARHLSRHFSLDMTIQELQSKKNMFEHFKSYVPSHLIDRFGFPDQFRVLPKYDYIKEARRRESTFRACLRKMTMFRVASPAHVVAASLLTRIIVYYNMEYCSIPSVASAAVCPCDKE